MSNIYSATLADKTFTLPSVSRYILLSSVPVLNAATDTLALLLVVNLIALGSLAVAAVPPNW